MKNYKYRWYYAMSIPFRCAPLCFCLRIVVLVMIRLLPIVQAFATASFIDGALAVLQGEKMYKELVYPVLLLGGTIIFKHMGSIGSNLLNQCIGNKVRVKYMEYLIQKCATLPYPYIEEEEKWNLIKRVKTKPDETVQEGMENMLNIAGILIQIASLLAILFFKVGWSVLVILFFAATVVRLAMKSGKEQYEVQRKNTRLVRKYQYIGDVLTSREAVEERSLFQFFGFFQKYWKVYYQKARKEEKKVVVKNLVRMKIVSSSMALVMFLIATLMLFPVASGRMTVGLYISMIQVASSLVDIMSWELSDSINIYAKYKEYIKDVIRFSNLEEIPNILKSPQKNIDKVETIELKDVSFSYPGVKKKILSHINLKIEPGKHYAIVGRNGAGKTTLIKILTGLYTEFDGDILFNGNSIRKIDSAELKAMISVLFQDFARYEISLKDNIALGNISELKTENQLKEIESVAGLLGLQKKIEDLPNGMNTVLGKIELNGQELSGGEWQRVAMARTVLSPAELLILDEPTASMDPISESVLYEEFKKVGKERTTLFISHRLGSTMLADEIIVLEKGKIIQQGSHEKLMNSCPIYKKMYESQRRWYVDEA